MQFGKLCLVHLTYRLGALEGIPASPDDDGGVDDDSDDDRHHDGVYDDDDRKPCHCTQALPKA